MNNRSEARQNAHIEALERWYEREMDNLDEDLMQGRINQDEYNKLVKSMNRDYAKDYNDIVAR